MHLICEATTLLALLQVACAGFGYSKRLQHMWVKEHKYCGGEWQSPIALTSAEAEPLPLPAVERISYHNLLSGPIKITNNGHSVALSFQKEHSRNRLPYVFGGLLVNGRQYELEGLHFHWGKTNNRGSEHTLNGVRFPMEMHIIHRNMKYDTLEEAQVNKDGLTVLGVFFQLQDEDNENLSPILNTFPHVKWVNSISKLNGSITLASLMPHDTDVYYTYKGSLTTPPCYEAVTWIVFATPVQISFKQMERFRKLSDGEQVLADNYRILQEIGNRKVYVRRLDPFVSSEKMIDMDPKELQWEWQ